VCCSIMMKNQGNECDVGATVVLLVCCDARVRLCVWGVTVRACRGD